MCCCVGKGAVDLYSGASLVAALLALSFALGLGDGHDDNYLLHPQGSLVRVDFGFVLGDVSTDSSLEKKFLTESIFEFFPTLI